MERLDRNELFLIALQLDVPEILGFCESSKRIDRLLCQQDPIWYAKLNTDYPNYLDFGLNNTPRYTYKFLNGLHSLKQKLNLKGTLLEIYNLTSLDLSYQNLTKLPSEIGNLHSLTYLSLNNNKLTNIPSEIGNLHSLTELYLSDNNLTEVPSEIGNLHSLTRLFVK